MCTEHQHWHHDYVRLAWDAGFCFNMHKSKLTLDWSSISIIDIERVTRDRDVAIIEKHISSILNYYLEEEQRKILDPTFVKVFNLSQLSIQYLQFCKRYLDNTVVLLKKELAKYKEENANLKDFTDQLKTEIADLKIKVKELKASLQSQPALIADNGNSFKCSSCSKVFLNEEYLLAHIKRRHQHATVQTETDKLQLEIKELKERLNTTEKYIHSDHKLNTVEVIPNNDCVIPNEEKVEFLVEKFEQLKLFVEKELTALRDEKQFQDKYEKWFELLFERLNNSKKELQDEKYHVVLSNGDGNHPVQKNDNATQTISITLTETQIMTEQMEEVKERKAKSPISEVDVQKMQENLISNTENHLGQIQDVLEQKLSGGLEQIQSQISVFWKKINDMEENKKLTVEKQSEKEVKQHPSTIKHSDTSSETTDSEEEKMVIETQPKPAPRITKSKTIVVKKSAPKIEVKHFAKANQSSSSSTSLSSSSSEREKKRNNAALSTELNITQNIKQNEKTKLEVKTIYDKRLQITFGSRSSLSEIETDEHDSPNKTVTPSHLHEVPTKPSTSTLGRRSITSLKQAVKDKDVLQGLRKALDERINLKMKEIGVSPLWKGIPQRSYFKALEILEHQADLTAKKYPNYWKIKDKILSKLHNNLKKKKKSPQKSLKASRDLKISDRRDSTNSKKQGKNQKSPDLTKITNLTSEDDADNIKQFPLAGKHQPVNSSALEKTKDLKITPSTTPIKKKVLFDLENSTSSSKIVKDNIAQQKLEIKDEKLNFTFVKSNNLENQKVDGDVVQKIDLVNSRPRPALKINDGGSTSSLDSSIFEALRAHSSQKQKKNLIKDDVTDWDVTDILE